MIDYDSLDRIAMNVGIGRKMSDDPTEECPVWDRFVGAWVESDEQFRVGEL